MNKLLALKDTEELQQFGNLLPELTSTEFNAINTKNIARDPNAELTINQGGKPISGKVKAVDLDVMK